MAVTKCEKCGAIEFGGKCIYCHPALPNPTYYTMPQCPEFGLMRRATKVDVRPIEPLRHARDLAPFSSRRSIRAAGDVVTSQNLISSQTGLGVAWMETRGESKHLYIKEKVWTSGLIFRREAGAELYIEES